MSATLTTRHPLQPLPMAANQQVGSRRRSARLAFGDDERGNDGYSDGATKKSKQTSVSNSAARKAKTVAAYEEDDDGFTFTRTKPKAKSAKTAPAPRKQPIIEDDSRTEPANPTRKARQSPPASPDAKDDRSRRRSTRRAVEESAATEKAIVARDRRTKSTPEPAHVSQSLERQDRPKEQETKINLPFADTPVIQRNKAMRTARASSIGNRRSSLGLRGRRASSLIEQGGDAMPHKEVGMAQFYKHIASEGLSEPRRMKQLLTWCATRTMGEKAAYAPGIEGSARSAARVIQEELLKDISDRSEMSDWFSREETPPAEPLVKKPNPRNIANAQKIQDLERQIAEIRAQKATYKALLTLPSLPARSTSQTIDPSLLPPDQLALLEITTSTPPILSSTQSRLSSLTSSLELTTDTLAHAVHALQGWRTQADRVADRVLSGAAARLEKRGEKVKQRAGTGNVDGRDVLRALAGVLVPDGEGGDDG